MATQKEHYLRQINKLGYAQLATTSKYDAVASLFTKNQKYLKATIKNTTSVFDMTQLTSLLSSIYKPPCIILVEDFGAIKKITITNPLWSDFDGVKELTLDISSLE